MLKRIVLIMTLALALGACGMGGSSATVTPPPTSTAKPEPTARPTATEAAALPTAKPTSDTGSSTGGAGTIPVPPDSQAYVKGEDPVVDAAIDAMETEFAKQTGTGLDLGELQFYTSDATVDDTVAFYEAEMPNNGWMTGQTQDQDFGKVLAYVGNDLESVGLIGILDLSKTGAKGLIIFTTTGKSSAGGLDMPTAEATPADSTGSTGGDIPTDISDVPPPPDSKPYSPGDDTGTDSFLEGFAKGFAQSFEGQESIELKGQQEFLTPASQEDIKTFYDEEMQKLGWTTTESTPNPTAQILNYTRVNGTNIEVAVIASLGRSTFSPGSTDTLVVIVVAGSK